MEAAQEFSITPLPTSYLAQSWRRAIEALEARAAQTVCRLWLIFY